MPITFTNPPGHFPNWFGPGVVIDIGTSIADPQGGPFTIGGEFRFGAQEQLFYSFSSTPQATATYRHQLLYQPDGTQSPLLVGNTIPVDTQLTLSVQIRTDSGTILDQGTTQRPWNPTANEHLDIAQLLKAQGQGGFTAEDRANAQITQMGVSLPLPGLDAVQEIASGLTGFFTNPPAWANQQIASVDLVGRGSLTRPGAGRQVNAYGAQLDFKVIPLELGRAVGNPDVYFERIWQLAVVREALGGSFFNDIVREGYFDHQRVQWGAPFPSRIDYSIVPGGVVTLTWLHLAPGWWPLP